MSSDQRAGEIVGEGTLPRPDTDVLASVVEWLCEDMAYPFDFATTALPPIELRWRIEDYWAERDGANDEEKAAIRKTTAEEGGWLT